MNVLPEEPRHPPIFILSLPRSGSTLLRNLVDTHSQICSPGEINLASLCWHLRFTLTRTFGRVQGEISRQQIADLVAVETRRIVSGIMEAYARGKGKEIWCEKTAGYLEHLESIELAFPDARFLCLYRNCMDVVQSQLEVNRHGFLEDLVPYAMGNPMNLVAAMMDSWSDKTEIMLDLQQRLPDRSFAIRYEDLVADPGSALPPVFEFFGVPWEPEIPARAFQVRHENDGGDVKVHFTQGVDAAYIGKGSTILWEEMTPRQVARANAVLRRLDYPELTPDWDDIPSPYLRNAASPGPRAAMTAIREVFETHIPGNLERNAAVLGSMRVTYKFVVSGNEGDTWMVDLKAEPPSVVNEDREADCTIVLDGPVLLGIANREINAVTAFTQGQVRVQGDFELVHGAGLFL